MTNNKESNTEIIEKEIAKTLKPKISNTDKVKDIEKMVLEVVEERGYLDEDWKAHYAVKRIMGYMSILDEEDNEVDVYSLKSKKKQYLGILSILLFMRPYISIPLALYALYSDEHENIYPKVGLLFSVIFGIGFLVIYFFG